jgi:hypothetical protein
MSNKRKNIEESLLPGLDNGGGYSPAKVIQPGVEEGKKHTKIAIHTVSQFYGDNKQLSLFSDEKIDAFSRATGLSITNRPDSYGVV